MQSAQFKKGNVALGIFLIAPIFMGYLLLTNFGTGGEFDSLVVFFIIAAFAGMGSIGAYILGYRPFRWFDGQFNLQDIIYIGVGFVGLFVSVYVITAYISGNLGILIGLFAGGIVLAIALFRSENFAVPFLAHGIYDSVVLMLASGTFGSIAVNPATLGVTTFSLSAGVTPDLVTQVGLQFLGPALAEEILKIATALGIGILFSTKNKWVMMTVAVLSWALLHSIVAYPYSINFASILPK